MSFVPDEHKKYIKKYSSTFQVWHMGAK
jgi:hypothetical protein